MARYATYVSAAAALSLTLLLGGSATRVAVAQDTRSTPTLPMQVVAPRGPAQGGTETLAQIEARDRQIRAEIEAGTRPRPPVLRPGPTEMEDDDTNDRKLTIVPPRAGEMFVAPPFVGAGKSRATYPNLSPTRASAPDGDKQTNAPQSIVTGFATNSLNDDINILGIGGFPPDTMGAVGPNHVVLAVNSSVGIYTKTGTRVSYVSCDSFFVVPSTAYPRNGTFDQRILFDRRSGRWFATTMEFGSPQQVDNDVILAVSATSDPTGAWTKYVIPFGRASAGGINYFTDYSTLGVDDNGVYFAARIFPTSGASFTRIIVTPKASLIAASPSLGTTYLKDNVTDIFGTPQPSQNYDPVSSTRRAFVVGSSNFTAGLVYYPVDWNGASPNVPTISASGVSVGTPAFAGLPPNAPASGSTTPINVGDIRLQQVITKNNRLWACRNVGVDASGGASANNRCAAEWLEFNASGTSLSLVQSGRVFDTAASDPRFYYYPSLVANGQGHVAMGYSGSKSTEFVGAYTSGRLATDPLGTMQSIALLKAGVAKYVVNDGGGRNRWGDYSFTSLDPNDNMTIWTIQEFAGPRNAPNNLDTWGTWTNALRSPAPTISAASDVRLVPGRTNQSFTLTGTGFYDPGTGYTNRIAGALSGTGISNVRVTYNSATSITVTVDVASNAPVGARNVTITNPDTLTGTLANAVTVGAAAPSLFVTPGTLTRSGADLFMQVRVTNNGGASAANVTLSSVTLQVGAGSQVAATLLPPVGAVASGATVTVTVRFPSASVASGAAVYRAKGTYTGGAVTATGRVTVP